MRFLEIILWASIALIIYTYIGYPVALFLLSSIRQMARDLRFIVNRVDRRTPRDCDPWPAVSLIVPAYNEEDVIAAKVENALALDYPADRLEIIIASDGSTDATNRIVESYVDRAENRGRLKLINFTDRGGKISVVNRIVPQTAHEIVVLSDANTMYEPKTVKNLVRHFTGDDVGVVVGEMVLSNPSEEHKGEKYYWRYEVMLKFMENKLGAILGASGGIYAIRKALFEPVPNNTIVDDFVIPLKIAERGYRQVYSPEARAFEDTARNVQAEVVRHERIAAGNFQSIMMLWRLLNPLRGYIAFTFVSHKLLRWSAPLFMLLALGANVPLAFAGSGTFVHARAYSAVLVLQALFYAAAVAGACSGRLPGIRRLCGVPYYFVTMNLALMKGFCKFVRGTQKVTWKKIAR